MKKQIKNSRKETKWVELTILSLIIGWMTSFLVVSKPELSMGLTHTVEQNFGQTILVMGIVAFISLAVGIWKESIQHLFLPITVFAASITGMERINSPWVVLGFSCVILLSVWYVKKDILFYLDALKLSDRMLKILFIILGVFLFSFIGIAGYVRYVSFQAPHADLGIFSQIFEYMKETGIPYSTLERQMPMSHFKVHISPVLYLVLPFYIMFPNPLTLQFVQAFFVALSLWPLYLLAKHYHFSNKAVLAFGFCYCLYPALSGSCFADFHENCFIPFFLLFLIVAIEKKKNVLFALFLIAMLSIKEDAAIQLIFLSLFYIISKKDRKRGGIMLCASAGYLFIALSILNRYGLGVLEYMNNMYLSETGNSFQIVKTSLMNPGYTLRQCFDVKEKVDYLIWILLPLSIAVIPKKKFTNYLLLCPFVLLNLLPDYSCMSSIYFQYNFAVTVFIFYLAMINLQEWKAESKRNYWLLSLVLTVFVFFSSAWQINRVYQKEYQNTAEESALITEKLSAIPKDASVGASSRFIPHLWNHKVLYFIFEQNVEYVAVDLRSGEDADEVRIRERAEQAGYIEVDYVEGTLLILRKGESK